MFEDLDLGAVWTGFFPRGRGSKIHSLLSKNIRRIFTIFPLTSSFFALNMM